MDCEIHMIFKLDPRTSNTGQQTLH